jgi:RNA polymerase sigma factor (sigma-70 family)
VTNLPVPPRFGSATLVETEATFAPTAPDLTWEGIVRDHSARVYRLALHLTGNPHDAEDLTQDVFVRVFNSLSQYKPGTFEGWLHRITTNLFLDRVRRRRRGRDGRQF